MTDFYLDEKVYIVHGETDGSRFRVRIAFYQGVCVNRPGNVFICYVKSGIQSPVALYKIYKAEIDALDHARKLNSNAPG